MPHDPRTQSPLYRLFVSLINSAAANPGRKFGKVLNGGATVSVTIDAQGRRSIEIWRSNPPKISEGNTFMRYWPEEAPSTLTWVRGGQMGSGHTITASWPKPGTVSVNVEEPAVEYQAAMF